MTRVAVDSSLIFAGLQIQMEARLRGRAPFPPDRADDIAALAWLDWLVTFLPKRYRAERAVVVGAGGQFSELLDAVIFARQCSRDIVRRNGIAHVPAACVHAVIAVNQSLSLAALRTASSQLLSVRTLVTRGRSGPPKGRRDKSNRINQIMGCLIAIDGKLGPRHLDFLQNRPQEECIDIACSLSGTIFKLDHSTPRGRHPPPYKIKHSQSANSLVAFLLTLLLELQNGGAARRPGTTARRDQQ